MLKIRITYDFGNENMDISGYIDNSRNSFCSFIEYKVATRGGLINKEGEYFPLHRINKISHRKD